ncbi:hypothetical protein ADIARSV_3456 [Arcticibacter svalbardensis MN12-7]|uniref:Dinitrogenase iron-molybdenum cofactor biosynthesis domain-containing protein n=1 Tax=Arcticibacter svalbardensis MN12-7 TaxID=1150600 RepID=R9GNF5_9SPHI|nr:NifB/NifX family molybdenum-iron cluster-binding protein [Arcticibacter svalbardensis]EOR93377.1 hypothetical protein ADIARSV_3456 [Arcticibacter svalbardensis MN12-7]
MKIAVAVLGTTVSEHFGSAESIRIFNLDAENNITETETIQGSGECGCKSGMAGILAERGVKVLLAGNMGGGSHTLLERNHIVVYRGCSGEVALVLDNFLNGSLTDQGGNCAEHDDHHHHEGHECNHHHQ